MISVAIEIMLQIDYIWIWTGMEDQSLIMAMDLLHLKMNYSIIIVTRQLLARAMVIPT